MEFLQSFLRRHFAGESVVVSRNVGCFLRLRKRSFHMKRPLTSFRQIIFFIWWTYSCCWFLGAVSGSVTPVSTGVFQSMTSALGKPSFSSPRDLFWVLCDKIRQCCFVPQHLFWVLSVSNYIQSYVVAWLVSPELYKMLRNRVWREVLIIQGKNMWEKSSKTLTGPWTDKNDV